MFTITEQKTGRLVYTRALRSSGNFSISFIHSLNRTPVEDYYKIDGDMFVVYKTVFTSYGAGMPDIDEDASIEVANGEITISNLNITLSDFSVFIGTIASHKLIFDNEAFMLAELAPPMSLLKFEIKRVSLVEFLRTGR